MTHDELLHKVHCSGHTSAYVALLSVVELHKPSMQWSGGYDGEENPLYVEQCQECSGNGFSQIYPCPTIEAIEKELNA